MMQNMLLQYLRGMPNFGQQLQGPFNFGGFGPQPQGKPQQPQYPIGLGSGLGSGLGGWPSPHLPIPFEGGNPMQPMPPKAPQFPQLPRLPMQPRAPQRPGFGVQPGFSPRADAPRPVNMMGKFGRGQPY